MFRIWQFIREHLFEHITIISLAMINIPVLYKWLVRDGYGHIYAAIASIALDFGIYYVATEKQQSIYSRIALLLSTVLLISIQIHLFGVLTGILHSGYTLVATFILLHVQNKDKQGSPGTFEGSKGSTKGTYTPSEGAVGDKEGYTTPTEGSQDVGNRYEGERDKVHSGGTGYAGEVKGSQYTCEVCGKVFASSKGLKTHMGIVHRG
jgi:hypothetical protein